MKTKLEPKELGPLVEFINDCYLGDLAKVSNDLNRAIYMLHHVERDEVPEDELQNACFALYHISQRLFASYLEQS